NVLAQVQYFGGDIDLNDLLVTYTDASNVQQTVQASTLPGYSVTQNFLSSSNTPFGPADQDDYQWTFTVPNTSPIQLNWGWNAISSALQDIAVDTQSVPVPEPKAVALLGFTSLLLLNRKKRSLRA